MKLAIPASLLARMRQCAQDTYPEECCGLVIGSGERERLLKMDDVAPTRNVAEDPRRHFEVDPTMHLRVQRELRSSEWRVIGHYHSHPDGLAEPSDADRASVEDTDLVWIIVGGGESVRAWLPAENGSFSELDLIVC